MAESSSATTLGFIGLGKMGGAMAGRLLGAGCTLHVYDTNPAAVERLVRLGAQAATSPRQVADRARIVFASLPSPEISLEVALGQDGVIQGRQRAIYVETSTLGPHTVQAIDAGLRAAKVDLLDAPVSGGKGGAEQGTLAIMVSGPKAAVDETRPYLALIGKRVFEISEQPGMAQVMKLANALLSAATKAVSFEAMVFGAKAGLDPQVMLDVINASTGRNTATEYKIPRAVLTRTFDHGGRIGNMTKDLHLALAEAQRLGVPMWVSNSVAQIYDFAVTQGGINDDSTTLIKYMEQWAGVEVGRKSPGSKQAEFDRRPELTR